MKKDSANSARARMIKKHIVHADSNDAEEMASVARACMIKRMCRQLLTDNDKISYNTDGGEGSGNFSPGHHGRPGQVGGSSSDDIDSSENADVDIKEKHSQKVSKSASSKSNVTANTVSFKDGSSSNNVKKLRKGYKYRDIKCNGPRRTKKFIKQYVKEHPEVLNEGKKYTYILNKIKKFNKTHDPNDEGTFSATTGERINSTKGYWVTFHQNHSFKTPYKAYDSKLYGIMCAIAMRETGSKDVYIGYYRGYAEVSFYCEDEERAKKFAIEQNQQSYYDSEHDKTIENKKWNRGSNPIK